MSFISTALGGGLAEPLNGDRRDNRRCTFRLLKRSAINYFKKAQPNRSTGRRGISEYADGSIVVLIGSGGGVRASRQWRKPSKQEGALRDPWRNLCHNVADKQIILTDSHPQEI